MLKRLRFIWLYKSVSTDELEGQRIGKREAFEIKGCEKIHMIAFFLDGQRKTFVAAITALLEILIFAKSRNVKL